MTKVYTVFFPNGAQKQLSEGMDGVKSIYEPDPRNMEGSQFFVITMDDKKILRYANFPYIVETLEEEE